MHNKSFKENISRKLLELEFKSNHSIKLKCLRFTVKKILSSLQNLQNHCLSCTKHIVNIGSKKKVIMKIKKVRQKSRCANCMVDKSRFLKQKHNKKSIWNNINSTLFVY